MVFLLAMVNRDKYQVDSLLVKVMDQDQKEVELIVVGTPYNKTNTATMLTIHLTSLTTVPHGPNCDPRDKRALGEHSPTCES